MGCSASVPAPAPAAEPEADAPVVPGAHVPQRMSMSELGRQLTSSSMGMHLSRNSAPPATKRRSSLFRRQSKEELPPAVRINPLTDLFDEFTPMVGMLFDDFKKCGHIPRSDEARREGWLTEFDPEVHQAVFVSQNWWHRPKRGRASPDFPEGHEQVSLKWSVVVKGVENLVTGWKRVEGKKMKEVTYDAVLDRERAFIWFDYFSIDQDDSRVKSLGIQSLIHYTTNCTAMLIPTPHAEVMAFYPEKLPVYGKRAWCRAEFFVFALYAEMVGRDVRLYAAATDGVLRQFQDLKFHGDLFKDMPTDGEVTVEEDRHEIRRLEDTMIDAYGHAVVRTACAESPSKISLGAKLLRDAHIKTLVKVAQDGDLATLESIALSNNQLSDQGLDTLMSALPELPDLMSLELKGNHFSMEGRDRARAACAPRRAKILFDVEAPRRVSMLAAMSPSSRGSSKKSINAGAIAPELKAMAEASKRRTT